MIKKVRASHNDRSVSPREHTTEDHLGMDKLIKEENVRCGKGGDGGEVEVIVSHKDMDLLLLVGDIDILGGRPGR